MGTNGKDNVPILTAEDWPSDYNPNQRFSHRTRSVSISMPVSSTELNSGPTNRDGFTSPLNSERKTCDVQRQQREPVEQKHTRTRNHNHPNEHLLRSGKLGMCNDAYCITCPTSCHYEQLISEVPQGFDHQIDDIWYGGAKLWARENLSFLKVFSFGVLNPHAKAVLQWNQFILYMCLFAVFVDPLFAYLLSVKKDLKCIVIDWPMTKTMVVLRSMADLTYLMHMLVQFRLAFTPMESRTLGAPGIVDDPRRTALNYFSRNFFFDLISVLPVPQIIVLLIIPNAVASSGANYANNLLRTTVLILFIPRWYRYMDLVYSQRTRGYLSQSGSAIFSRNLVVFIMAGHVVGSCWYLLGLQRVNQCLVDACHNSGIANCMKFIDCGHWNDSQALGGFQQWNEWKQNGNSSACFTEDGFPYGIYMKAVNLTAEDSIITRYVYSFFWGFQQISTLAGNQTPSYSVWEVLFTICITGVGIVQFALLIGNMQVYAQGLIRRTVARSVKRSDVEAWMFRRNFPRDLVRKVRMSECLNWAATKGIDEEMLMESLPEDLQRDIRRHLYKFIKKVQIFALMDEPVLDAICESLRRKTYIKGGTILYRGVSVTKMVFIARGKMESIGEDGNHVQLSEGDVCGEELLRWSPELSSVNRDTRNHRKQGSRLLSNRTVGCLTNVEAFVLHAADLEEVTMSFAGFFRNHRVQYALRNESPYWQGVAATSIQVAWRYRKKRLNRLETSHGHTTHPSRFNVL